MYKNRSNNIFILLLLLVLLFSFVVAFFFFLPLSLCCAYYLLFIRGRQTWYKPNGCSLASQNNVKDTNQRQDWAPLTEINTPDYQK